MASIRVLILRKTHPQYTAGASVLAPTYLTSASAAVAWVGAEMNTAALFDSIIVSKKLASASPAKRRSRRSRSKGFETRVSFDMMPAYAARPQGTQDVSLQSVNTPLAAKAKEEMSDFEREYPW